MQTPPVQLLSGGAQTAILRLTTSFAVSLSVTLVAGPSVIRWLQSRYRERIASDSVRLNEIHAAKQNTPTMGGLLIISSILITMLMDAVVWHTTTDRQACMLTGATALLFLWTGATDDWIKIRSSRKGLSVRTKFLLQWVIGFIAAGGVFAVRSGLPDTDLSRLPLDSVWYAVPWFAFVIVAASNAVNLTDGLDGLASGCTTICSLAMAIILCGLLIRQSDTRLPLQTAACLSAVAGATAGFLWFNRHPAKVFMGDAGSLPLGSLLAVTSLLTATEFVLAGAGFVFVVETLSVVLQVAVYRRTGRRILLCSPLHNHFVFRGVHERQIVASFWIAALLCSALSIAAADLLKLPTFP